MSKAVIKAVSVPIIRDAQTPEEVEAARMIFRRQVELWRNDPTLLGLEVEFADLPGIYSPPRGALLLAYDEGGAVLGTGAMRPLPGAGDCGLTALIIDPAARGRGLGRLMLRAMIDRALAAGHRRMHLETSGEDPVAVAMWQSAGFVPGPAYFPNPRPGSQHMVLDLTQFG